MTMRDLNLLVFPQFARSIVYACTGALFFSAVLILFIYLFTGVIPTIIREIVSNSECILHTNNKMFR